MRKRKERTAKNEEQALEEKEIDEIRKRKKKAAEQRRMNFRDKIRYEPIFPCISCEPLSFENGVKYINEDFLKDIRCCNILQNLVGSSINDHRYHAKIFIKCYEKTQDKEGVYACHTCLKYTNKTEITPIAAVNGLKVSSLPGEFSNMSHLEPSLIAKKLIFQKIFPLKLCPMPPVIDKLTMAPIAAKDISNTPKAFQGYHMSPESLMVNGRGTYA